MINFFCLSKNKQDLDLAIAMAGVIGNFLNQQCLIVARENCSSWCSNVSVQSNHLGGDFRDYRSRNPHANILYDQDDKKYYNLWCQQSRGNYLVEGRIEKSTIFDIMSEIILDLGCRKPVDFFEIFCVHNKFLQPGQLSVPRSEFWYRCICVLDVDQDPNESKKMTLPYSTYHFWFNKSSPHRVNQLADVDTGDAIKMSDYVVLDNPATLLKYYSQIKEKQIIILCENNNYMKALCDMSGLKIDYFSDFSRDFMKYSIADKKR